MKNVNPTRMTKTNARFFQLQSKMFEMNILNFFEDQEALVEKYSKMKTFSMEIFQKEPWDSKFFIYNELFLRVMMATFSSLYEIIPIVFTSYDLCRYIVPIGEFPTITHRELKSKVSSDPMEQRDFWPLLYSLIIDPGVGAKILKTKLFESNNYIIEFMVKERVTLVRLSREGKKWRIHTFNENIENKQWAGGDVFLYFKKNK